MQKEQIMEQLDKLVDGCLSYLKDEDTLTTYDVIQDSFASTMQVVRERQAQLRPSNPAEQDEPNFQSALEEVIAGL